MDRVWHIDGETMEKKGFNQDIALMSTGALENHVPNLDNIFFFPSIIEFFFFSSGKTIAKTVKG